MASTLIRTTKDQGPRTKDPATAVRDSAIAVQEVTVILVSWNDVEDLRACVESLAEARRRMPGDGPRVSLVVVENGGGRPEILSLWPGAAVLVNQDNRGFGPAANQGADIAPGDVLLFLNPDTRAEGDPFTAISRGFDAHPEAAALAPRLLDFDAPSPADGPSKIQNPKFPDRSLLPTAKTSSRFNCAGFRAFLPTRASCSSWTLLLRTTEDAAAGGMRIATGTARSRSSRPPPRPWRSARARSESSTASTPASSRPGSKTWICAPAFPARGNFSIGRKPVSGTAAASLRRPWVTPAFCRSITATPSATGAFTTDCRRVFSTGRSSSPGCFCASSSFRFVRLSRVPAARPHAPI